METIRQGEHGEENDDEINVVERGGNYGRAITGEACQYGSDDPVAPSHHERGGGVAPMPCTAPE